MDSRYVSEEQANLNLIIKSINKQLSLHAKAISVDTAYAEQLMQILSKIYAYSGQAITVNKYFNSENLLSEQPAPLPLCQSVLPNPELFDNLLNDLSNVVNRFKVEEKQKYKTALKNKVLKIHFNDAKQKLLANNIALIKTFVKQLNEYLKNNQNKMISNESGRRDDVQFLVKALDHWLKLEGALVKRFNESGFNLSLNQNDFAGLPYELKDYLFSMSNFLVTCHDRLDKLKTSMGRSTLRSSVMPVIKQWYGLMQTLTDIEKKALVLQELKEQQNDAEIYVLSDEVLANIFQYVESPLKLHLVSQRFYQAGKESNWKNRISVDFNIPKEKLSQLKINPSESYADVYKRLKDRKCYLVFYQTKDTSFTPIEFLNNKAQHEKNYFVTDSLQSARNFRNMGLQSKGNLYICEVGLLSKEVSQSMEEGNWEKVAPRIKRVHYLISPEPTEVEYDNGTFIAFTNTPKP